MATRSTIDPATLNAYRETEYRVFGEQPFVLRVDQHSAALAAAHARLHVGCSAYITACNPRGRLLDAAANACIQAALARELDRLGLMVMAGVGEHPGGGWPGEASFLVFGLPLAAAKALGRGWRQNALLWSAEDAVPRLVLLR